MVIRIADLRRLHRRLGLVVGLQVLLWTASGIYFAWTDLDEIHGDHLRQAETAVPYSSNWMSPSDIDFGDQPRPARIADLAVVRVGDVTLYRLRAEDGRVLLADAQTGQLRKELTEDEARRLAEQSFSPEVPIVAATYLEDVGAHHEYRGGALPAWAFRFDHPSRTRIYVASREAVVTKHRNERWRVFDFLWMLHTMDYRGRDDINNAVLRTVSVLALSLAITGYWLWMRTTRGRRNARRPA